MTCPGVSTEHDGFDIRAVRFGISSQVRSACAGCRRGFEAQGLTVRIVERRFADVSVKAERRHKRPAWMERLTARDLTGLLR